MKSSIWNDKIVFITGGSSGIGLAIAKRFAQQGAHIAIFARRTHQLALAAVEITNAKINSHQHIRYYRCDVSKHSDVKQVFPDVVDEIGSPDVLVNCAGRAIPNYVSKISSKQFIETMQINFFSQWYTIKTLLPHLKKRGGYIVNTSSIAGFLGVFGYSDYCSSKFAIHGLSEVLRSELKSDNIHVSILCPPDTDTPGLELENKTKPPETSAISSKARLASADKVAKVLLKGLRRKRFLIIPGLEGKFAWYAKRLAPWLLDMIMDSQIKKIRLQKGAPHEI